LPIGGAGKRDSCQESGARPGATPAGVSSPALLSVRVWQSTPAGRFLPRPRLCRSQRRSSHGLLCDGRRLCCARVFRGGGNQGQAPIWRRRQWHRAAPQFRSAVWRTRRHASFRHSPLGLPANRVGAALQSPPLAPPDAPRFAVTRWPAAGPFGRLRAGSERSRRVSARSTSVVQALARRPAPCRAN